MGGSVMDDRDNSYVDVVAATVVPDSGAHAWDRPLVPERVAERITHRPDDRPRARLRVMLAIAGAMREYARQEHGSLSADVDTMVAECQQLRSDNKALTGRCAGLVQENADIRAEWQQERGHLQVRVEELIRENERLHAELARKGKRG